MTSLFCSRCGADLITCEPCRVNGSWAYYCADGHLPTIWPLFTRGPHCAIHEAAWLAVRCTPTGRRRYTVTPRRRRPTQRRVRRLVETAARLAEGA